MDEHDTPPEPVEFVPAETLQAMFNNGDYMDRLSSGQLVIDVVKENHLRVPEAKLLPRCTLGQLLRYKDESGHWIAEVHQYLKPNGSLGGSGKPDPKRIRHNGKVYALRRILPYGRLL